MSILTYIFAKLRASLSSNEAGGGMYPQERFEEDVMDEILELKQTIHSMRQVIIIQQQQLNSMQQVINQYVSRQYNDCSFQTNSGNTTINNYYSAPVMPKNAEEHVTDRSSCLFTKRAKDEGKISELINSLQQSYVGRTDKARALVEVVRQWQKDGYMDANYNARVMYDELGKLITMPFLYDGFRKYYNE